MEAGNLRPSFSIRVDKLSWFSDCSFFRGSCEPARNRLCDVQAGEPEAMAGGEAAPPLPADAEPAAPPTQVGENSCQCFRCSLVAERYLVGCYELRIDNSSAYVHYILIYNAYECL